MEPYCHPCKIPMRQMLRQLAETRRMDLVFQCMKCGAIRVAVTTEPLPPIYGAPR